MCNKYLNIWFRLTVEHAKEPPHYQRSRESGGPRGGGYRGGGGGGYGGYRERDRLVCGYS